jgi:hypothetical protein
LRNDADPVVAFI